MKTNSILLKTAMSLTHSNFHLIYTVAAHLESFHLNQMDKLPLILFLPFVSDHSTLRLPPDLLFHYIFIRYFAIILINNQRAAKYAVTICNKSLSGCLMHFSCLFPFYFMCIFWQKNTSLLLIHVKILSNRLDKIY